MPDIGLAAKQSEVNKTEMVSALTGAGLLGN